MATCLNCKYPLNRKQKKFCSNKCQIDFQYNQYIRLWEKGIVNGNRGIIAKNISRHLKRYLTLKFGDKCSQCGWSEQHPLTGNVSLDIDHIDGNADNNVESNLRLLCPNCHSLTFYYKNFNKKKGRIWRRNKYIKHT